ncbi:MAG: hypothetical protein WBC60_08735 [Cognaticolwellia sp.]|uniref:hypothetical protein n=1 Tax=Colwellia sp. Arc7-635 TaxID=2497879 RepID=UPI000F85006F|nr:hypothetical protein [Colwellia sp. Arc7-635]AZQ85030.1 hypothetical protein EKO29_14205 [Colwellia sp. Arc7-635]
MYKFGILVLILFNSFANACGENTEFSPLLELGAVEGKYIDQSKLFIPSKVNSMELVAVHFEIGNERNLIFPIQFYADAEYPSIHKSGYVTVLYTISEANLASVTVHANYKHPVGQNGEITFCIHPESFKLSELIEI